MKWGWARRCRSVWVSVGQGWLAGRYSGLGWVKEGGVTGVVAWQLMRKGLCPYRVHLPQALCIAACYAPEDWPLLVVCPSTMKLVWADAGASLEGSVC